MKKVAVILSGCGIYDGAEIHESVLTLLALDRAQAEIICAAPDIPQSEVVNHLTGKPVAGERRNVLTEAARIARGQICALASLRASDYDAVILPGGLGAGKNLSNFAVAGDKLEVNVQVAQLLKEAHQAGKPIGFICLAPVIAAALFGPEKVELTIGNDSETAAVLEKRGATHVNCSVYDIVIDRRLKIVTTPAYMLGERITEVEAGISKLVRAVLDLA
mgnify:CR=1 FL=1